MAKPNVLATEAGTKVQPSRPYSLADKISVPGSSSEDK